MTSSRRSSSRSSALARPSLPARALMAFVRAYQVVLSPFLGGHCRFEPSCSRYAHACLETHGAWRGSLLSMLRLCKCHPFHPGGYDPPPAPRASTLSETSRAKSSATSSKSSPKSSLSQVSGPRAALAPHGTHP